MRVVAFVAGAMVVLGACGGISAESAVAADGVVPTTITPAAPALSPLTDTSSTTRSPVPTLAEVDLVGYVSVIEHMLEGTAYEGAALESPEIFLATGALFCDQLDTGTTSDELLVDYIETLTGGVIDDASDDDLTMAGAVLGSGLATLCPHHIESFGASE